MSLQLEQKVIASEIFKGKKDNYPQSVPRLFINTRLGEWGLPSLGGIGGLMNSFLAGNSFLTSHLFGFNTGREEINAKVLQALENEALKVRDVSQYFCQAPTYSAEGQIRFLEKIQQEFYIV